MTNVLEPIESKVAARAALKSKLNVLQTKADELAKRLHSHNSFDAEKHTADLSDLYSQKDSTLAILKDIKSSIDKSLSEKWLSDINRL